MKPKKRTFQSLVLSERIAAPMSDPPPVPWSDGQRMVLLPFIKQFMREVNANEAFVGAKWADLIFSISEQFGKRHLSDKQLRVLYLAAQENEVYLNAAEQRWISKTRQGDMPDEF